MIMAPLSYGLQTPQNLIGTETAPVLLTTSYTNNHTILSSSGVAMQTLYIQYTAQTSGNSIQIKLEGTPDPSSPTVTPTFYQDTATSVTGGTATITRYEYSYTSTSTSPERIRIPFPSADNQLQISIKETVSSGTAGRAAVRVLSGPNN